MALPLKKKDSDPLLNKPLENKENKENEGYKEGIESSFIEDSPKPVNAGNWIMGFAAPLILICFFQLGEAVYTYTDNKERDDDFGKDIKEASLHQLIICALGLFLGLILYVLYMKEFASSTTFGIISLLSIGMAGYSGYIVYLQHKRYTDYENNKSANKRAYSTHAKSLFYADIVILSLMVIIFLICFFKWNSGRKKSDEQEAIEMK